MNYLYYIKNNCERNLHQNEYFSILSLSLTQEYESIIIFHKNNLDGKYVEYLMKNFNIKFKLFKNEMNNDYIINLLKISNTSGIFTNTNIIFLNKLNFLENNEYFNINNDLIYIKDNNYFEKNYDLEKFRIKVYNNLDNLEKIIYNYDYEEYFKVLNYDLIYLDYKLIDESYVDIDFTNKSINLLKLFYINILSKIKINNFNDNNLELINNIDKIYWINLEKSLDRKSNMINLFKNINIENVRINAVDGSLEEKIKETYFYGNVNSNNTNKEYSTILSHLNTLEEYKKVSNLKYGVSMICEDDLSLDFCKYWEYNLEKIINEAPEDWEILMLSYFTLNINFEYNYRKWDNDWSASCYLIRHSSLNKLDKIKNDKKYESFSDVMVADNYIFRIFNTYLFKNPYFTFPDNNNSTIHDYHLDYHRLYKNINKIIINKEILKLLFNIP